MAKFTIRDDALDTLKAWGNLLTKLTFTDNFQGYEWEGTIAAGEVKRIQHTLKRIPTRFIVVDSIDQSAILTRPSGTPASADFFYVTCASDFRGKILILP